MDDIQRQLRALAHPLRLQVLNALEGQQRATGKQLADLLQVPPARLHHHLKMLERADLIYIDEEVPRGGVIEKYYRLRSTTMRPARQLFDDPDPAVRAAAWQAAVAELPALFHSALQRLTHLSKGVDNPVSGEIAAWDTWDLTKEQAERIALLLETAWYEISQVVTTPADPKAHSLRLSVFVGTFLREPENGSDGVWNS